MFRHCQGFTMKLFQALSCKALLLFLIISGGNDCRPIQVPRDIESSAIDGRRDVVEKYLAAGGVPVDIRDVGSKDIKKGAHGLVKNTPLKRGDKDLKVKEVEFPHSSSKGNHQNILAAGPRQNAGHPTPVERVKIEIIERPELLKVTVDKTPHKEQSRTNKEKKESQSQSESPSITSSGLLPVEEDWDENFPVDDEDWSSQSAHYFGSGSGSESGSGSGSGSGSLNVGVIPQWKLISKNRVHPEAKSKHLATIDYGGIGLLWFLVVIALVLAVVSIVFARRSCWTPVVGALESTKVEKNDKVLSSNRSALKEARVKVGKQKSRENRKVLRTLSRGVGNEKEELALACSIISPSIDARKKNSEALHTRACVRAATSQSRRKSTFEEDLKMARCEFTNAPAKFAQLVRSAGDELKESTEQNSKSKAVKSDTQ